MTAGPSSLLTYDQRQRKYVQSVRDTLATVFAYFIELGSWYTFCYFSPQRHGLLCLAANGQNRGR